MTPTTAVVAGPTPDLTTAVGQPAPAFVAGAASNVPVTVTNAGTGPTTGPITTTMTLPTGTTAPAGFSNNGWSCATSGPNGDLHQPWPHRHGGSSTLHRAGHARQQHGGHAARVQRHHAADTPVRPTPATTPPRPMTPATAVAAAPAPDLTTVIGQPAPAFVAGIGQQRAHDGEQRRHAPTTGPITTTMTLPTGTSAPASFTQRTVELHHQRPDRHLHQTQAQSPQAAAARCKCRSRPAWARSAPRPARSRAPRCPTAGETNTGNNNPTNMTPSAAVVAAPAAPVAPTINNPTRRQFDHEHPTRHQRHRHARRADYGDGIANRHGAVHHHRRRRQPVELHAQRAVACRQPHHQCGGGQQRRPQPGQRARYVYGRYDCRPLRQRSPRPQPAARSTTTRRCSAAPPNPAARWR